jgi:hypothetical protein
MRHKFVIVRCEWIMGRGKQAKRCDHPAWWGKECRAGMWRLCDEHKRLLLDSYNKTWREKEEPEWKPINTEKK